MADRVADLAGLAVSAALVAGLYTMGGQPWWAGVVVAAVGYLYAGRLLRGRHR